MGNLSIGTARFWARAYLGDAELCVSRDRSDLAAYCLLSVLGIAPGIGQSDARPLARRWFRVFQRVLKGGAR
jgi:hypothetical protein